MAASLSFGGLGRNQRKRLFFSALIAPRAQHSFINLARPLRAHYALRPLLHHVGAVRDDGSQRGIKPRRVLFGGNVGRLQIDLLS